MITSRRRRAHQHAPRRYRCLTTDEYGDLTMSQEFVRFASQQKTLQPSSAMWRHHHEIARGLASLLDERFVWTVARDGDNVALDTRFLRAGLHCIEYLRRPLNSVRGIALFDLPQLRADKSFACILRMIRSHDMGCCHPRAQRSRHFNSLVRCLAR